jgi:hypothetical protein
VAGWGGIVSVAFGTCRELLEKVGVSGKSKEPRPFRLGLRASADMCGSPYIRRRRPRALDIVG